MQVAKTSGQKCWKLFAIDVDFIASATFTVLDEIREEWADLEPSAPLDQLKAAMPEWAEMQFALEDIPDAYNGVPVLPSHSRANISMLWSPSDSKWVCTSKRLQEVGVSGPALRDFLI